MYNKNISALLRVSSRQISQRLHVAPARSARTMLTLAARPRSGSLADKRPLRFASAFQQHRTMFIQTTPTPNDDALKFLPSQEVLPSTSGTLEYVSGRDAHSSPLARKLFAVDGIKSVMFGSDFITVEKDSEASWMLLKPEIFSILTEHLTAGLPVVIEGTEAAQDTMPSEEDDEVVSMIKELIDTRIRPAIQEDGGDLQYRGFTDEGVVLLKLQGACRSCDSSSVTLKHGIESMLMHYVEEVTGVEQVLDPEEEASLKQFEKLESKLKAASSNKDDHLEAPPAL